MYSYWSLVSYVLLPVGAITVATLLCGIEFFEKIGHKICRANIRVGGIRVRATLLILLIALTSFFYEERALRNMQIEADMTQRTNPVKFNMQFKMALWRHQRNWWLALCCASCWAIAWRLSRIVFDLRKEYNDKKAVVDQAKAAPSAQASLK